MELLTEYRIESERLLQLTKSQDGIPSVDSMDDLIENTQTLFESVDVEFIDNDALWRNAASDLMTTVCNLRCVTYSLIVRVTELAEKNEHVEKELEKVKRELEHLKKKLQKLEKNEQKLILGQIAFMIDEAVLSHVMKGIGDHKKLAIYTIHHLESAIGNEKRFTDTFRTENDRKTVESRWNKLKAHIGWQNKHYRDFDLLKELRLPSAHPEVTDKQLRDAIGHFCYDLHLKGVCEEFLEMMMKIR